MMLNHARHEKRGKTLMNFVALIVLWQKLIDMNDGFEGNFAHEKHENREES